MTLVHTDIGLIQLCKNPWKRGGLYYRGKMAPWVGDPSKLRPEQVKRVKALTKIMVDTCTGKKGTTGGVVNTALCLQKNIDKLTPEAKAEKYKKRLDEKRKGKGSVWYTE